MPKRKKSKIFVLLYSSTLCFGSVKSPIGLRVKENYHFFLGVLNVFSNWIQQVQFYFKQASSIEGMK